MTEGRSMRSAIAAYTPSVIRKGFRMAEHYVRRHAEWAEVLREMKGATPSDRSILLRSALAAPVSSLRRLDGFEPPHLLGDVTVDCDGVGQFALRAGTDDIIHVLGARETVVCAVIQQELKPGDVFVDAGANIGYFSVMAHRLVGPEGQVVAFEMMPPTAERLRSHFAINQMPSARIVENALSETDGDVIVATSSTQKYGQASIAIDQSATSAETVRFDVKTVTLDTALSDVKAISLMKIDVEGAEFMALKGASAVMARIRAIIFEQLGDDDRVARLLEEHGFAIEDLDGRNFLARRSADAGLRL